MSRQIGEKVSVVISKLGETPFCYDGTITEIKKISPTEYQYIVKPILTGQFATYGVLESDILKPGQNKPDFRGVMPATIEDRQKNAKQMLNVISDVSTQTLFDFLSEKGMLGAWVEWKRKQKKYDDNLIWNVPPTFDHVNDLLLNAGTKVKQVPGYATPIYPEVNVARDKIGLIKTKVSQLCDNDDNIANLVLEYIGRAYDALDKKYSEQKKSKETMLTIGGLLVAGIIVKKVFF